jgi:ABC-type protease/lipase transport system fused ATPase/permease subunit
MRLLMSRLPLFMGMILLQIPPATGGTPTNLTDLLLQALPQVPIYVILAYIVINIQRTTAKENERRDEHEKTITTALITERGRIDDIEDDRRKQWETQKQSDSERDNRYIETFQSVGDSMNRIADLWTAQQKREGDRDRILSDAASAMTSIVTVGSKPLQQVVKDVGALQDTSEDIQKVVGQIFNKAWVVFPTDKPIDTFFEELKRAIIEELEKICAEKVRATQETPAVNVVTINTGAPPIAADAPGSEAAA